MMEEHEKRLIQEIPNLDNQMCIGGLTLQTFEDFASVGLLFRKLLLHLVRTFVCKTRVFG